jgi:hypothetical protein
MRKLATGLANDSAHVDDGRVRLRVVAERGGLMFAGVK